MMIHYKIAAGFAIALGVWLLSHLSLDARLLSPIAPLNSTVAAGAFPKRLHNPLGHEQVLQQAPARIASGILAADEIFAILRAKNRLVAVTDIADDPGISNVAHFYSTDVVRSEADTEVLLATAPDMVVVAAYSDAATVRLLLSTNVPVLRIPEFTSFADIKRNTMTLASAIGEEERGAEVLARMQQRLDVVANAIKDQPKPRVLYYSPSGSAAGIGTLSDETITLAGGFNVIRETGLKGSSLISQELAIALQPEVILLDIWGTTNGDPAAVNTMLQDPAWRGVPAVKQGRVYVVNAAIATTCSPFRVIGVETIAHLLHPNHVAARSSDAEEVANWL